MEVEPLNIIQFMTQLNPLFPFTPLMKSKINLELITLVYFNSNKKRVIYPKTMSIIKTVKETQKDGNMLE